MPKVVKEEKDALNAVLTVTLEKEDYLPRVNSELQKYRKKAQMKGFRKGKTPMGLLKKMYGQGVLVDVVNDMMQKEIGEYLREADLDILGQPLPSEEQKALNFDINEPEDFEFKFDLGLAPDFELEGVSEEDEYEIFETEVPDDKVDEEMELARKRAGNREVWEGEIEKNDVLKLGVIELKDNEIKDEGVEAQFSILVDQIDSEELKNELIGQKQGYTFRFHLQDIEADKDMPYYKKMFLNMEEDDDTEVGDHFEGFIEEVLRLHPAEMNEDFFKQAFGDESIDTEDKARERLREDLQKFYSNQAESLLYRDLQDILMEKNEIDLPDAFLKRWLINTNERITEENIDHEWEHFGKNLHWTLIRNKIIEKFDVKVEVDEVKARMKQQVMNYFGGQMDEAMLEPLLQRMMGNEDQVNEMYQEVMSDKVFNAIRDNVTLKPVSITVDELQNKMDEARSAAKAAAHDH